MSVIRTNFKVNKQNNDITTKTGNEDNEKIQTKEEFEEFTEKSGAIGSFMIYRSSKKDEELGIDEL